MVSAPGDVVKVCNQRGCVANTYEVEIDYLIALKDDQDKDINVGPAHRDSPLGRKYELFR